MINLTTGSMASGMSLNSCTPPALNGDPSRAVPVGDPGQGACIRRQVSPAIPVLSGGLIDPLLFQGVGLSDLWFDCVRFGHGLDAPDGLLSGGVRSFDCGDTTYLTCAAGYRS